MTRPALPTFSRKRMRDGKRSLRRARSRPPEFLPVTNETRRPDHIQASLRSLEEAVQSGLPAHAVFQYLHEALAENVGFKVLTVLKLDSTTLRSVRLYSSEPSYPIGGTKQHVRSGWSDAILDRRTVYRRARSRSAARDFSRQCCDRGDRMRIHCCGADHRRRCRRGDHESMASRRLLRRNDGTARRPIRKCHRADRALLAIRHIRTTIGE